MYQLVVPMLQIAPISVGTITFGDVGNPTGGAAANADMSLRDGRVMSQMLLLMQGAGSGVALPAAASPGALQPTAAPGQPPGDHQNEKGSSKRGLLDKIALRLHMLRWGP